MKNIPNKITAVRFLMIPAIIAIFLCRFPYSYLVASVLFAITAFTDFVDGYLARRLNQVTTIGKFLDPIADKVLVTAGLILLVEAGVLPFAFGSVAVIVILARDFLVNGLRQVAATKDVVLSADKLGKAKTVVQDVAITILFLCPQENNLVYNQTIYYIGLAAFCLALLLTVVSGAHYIYKNRAVLKTEASATNKDENQSEQ